MSMVVHKVQPNLHPKECLPSIRQHCGIRAKGYIKRAQTLPRTPARNKEKLKSLEKQMGACSIYASFATRLP